MTEPLPLLCTVESGVGRLQLNRPQTLNALDETMMESLRDATALLAATPDLSVVVIEGAGDHFMAGGDLRTFAALLEHAAEAREAGFREMISGCINPSVVALRSLSCPVVACVQGACAGFGLALALACDHVLADENAYFNTAYLGMGLTPDGGGSRHLAQRVGSRKALSLFLSPRRISAAEAAALGLVDEVTNDLPAARDAYINHCRAMPRQAVARLKALLAAAEHQCLAEQLASEADAFSRCGAETDFAEGVQAFFEKRPPRFNGGATG